MRIRLITLSLGLILAIVGVSAPSQAQQVTMHSPFHTVSDSFFETNAISWSGMYRGVTFSYGGGALAQPPFGSPQNAAGLTTNFSILGKNGYINFATNFSEGSQRSLVTQTPSVTVMNGQTGFTSDTSQTPFVISVVPVVGAFPAAPPMPSEPGIDPRVQAMLQARADAQAQDEAQAAAQAQAGGVIQPLPAQPRQNNLAPRHNQPNAAPAPQAPDPGDAAAELLNEAQKSTAGRPAPSVAEAKRMHDQEKAAADEELAALMVRAQALEEDGKPSVAKIYYQRVAKHATGALQQQARQKVYELDSLKR